MKEARATIIPTLRYRDAVAAIDWLCKAFGFRRHLVAPAEDGKIAHAQLVLGNGMIMLGSTWDDEFGKLQRPMPTPDAPVSQSPYIIVADVDAHHAVAAAAGAQVVMAPKDEDYGGGATVAGTPKGIFGTSEATTPGRTYKACP